MGTPVGAPDGYQNVKTPATSPSACVYAHGLLLYERAQIWWQTIPSSHSQDAVRGKKKQKTNQYRKIVSSQGKVGLVKAFDRRVCGLQSADMSTCRTRLPEESPPPLRVLLLIKTRGKKFPHWMNSTEGMNAVLNYLLLSWIKASDQQLLRMHFLNHVQKLVGSKNVLFFKGISDYTKRTPL